MSKTLSSAREEQPQVPLSLIETWLKVEADRGITEKLGPDDYSPPMGDVEIQQADELRAWWIVHVAFNRCCPGHEPHVLKSLVIHVHYHGKKPSSFWLYRLGTRGWSEVLNLFYRNVHEVAAETPYDKFAVEK